MLSKKGLESAIFQELTTVPLDTQGVISSTIKSVPQPDGSTKTEVDIVTGPVYMDKQQARVISKGIAKAVVDHLTSSAETSSGDTIK